MKTPYDIVIIGGGLVGFAFLLALPERLQQRTLLLDGAEQPDGQTPSPSFDDRGTALSRRSLELLAHMGVLSELAPHLGAMHDIEVSQQGYWGTTRLTSAEAYGAVANNRQLGHALWQRAKETAAECRFQQFVSGITPGIEQSRVHFTDGSEVDAHLVVLADGGRSGIATHLGIGQQHHDYGQTAIVFNLEREQPAGGRAYERFTSDGPRALLPLAGRRQTVVWTIPTNTLETHLNWSDHTWKRQLLHCFGHDQGAVTAVSARAHYPLHWRQSRELVRHRLALIGNSALSLHPVAGQGFNLHLRSLVALADALATAVDPGDIAHLQRWQAESHIDQQRIAMACHGLVSMFAYPQASAAHARGLSLAGLDLAPMLKRWITQYAMGYTQ
ncbi:FAD-dependent monooxygenase [Salinispirillum sp. LH 10-3-1]|uniref:FAD-dependent monooxygenase n=1 Tax=Salinispirillum sp. LH 10-3-1 TaxID=2952525 RepID=A0AB38YI65_9GAMM